MRQSRRGTEDWQRSGLARWRRAVCASRRSAATVEPRCGQIAGQSESGAVATGSAAAARA